MFQVLPDHSAWDGWVEGFTYDDAKAQFDEMRSLGLIWYESDLMRSIEESDSEFKFSESESSENSTDEDC